MTSFVYLDFLMSSRPAYKHKIIPCLTFNNTSRDMFLYFRDNIINLIHRFLSPKTLLLIFPGIGSEEIHTCAHSFPFHDNEIRTPSCPTCFRSTRTDIHRHSYINCFFCSWLWVWFDFLRYRNMQTRILTTRDKMDVEIRHFLRDHFVLPLLGKFSLIWFLDLVLHLHWWEIM